MWLVSCVAAAVLFLISIGELFIPKYVAKKVRAELEKKKISD